MDWLLRKRERQWLATRDPRDWLAYVAAMRKTGRYCDSCLAADILIKTTGRCEHCEETFCEKHYSLHYPTSGESTHTTCVVCGRFNTICCTYQTFCGDRHIDPVCEFCCQNHFHGYGTP